MPTSSTTSTSTAPGPSEPELVRVPSSKGTLQWKGNGTGLSKVMGGIPNSWLVYVMENHEKNMKIPLKWMIWGYPMTLETSIDGS